MAKQCFYCNNKASTRIYDSNLDEHIYVCHDCLEEIHNDHPEYDDWGEY